MSSTSNSTNTVKRDKTPQSPRRSRFLRVEKPPTPPSDNNNNNNRTSSEANPPLSHIPENQSRPPSPAPAPQYSAVDRVPNDGNNTPPSSDEISSVTHDDNPHNDGRTTSSRQTSFGSVQHRYFINPENINWKKDLIKTLHDIQESINNIRQEQETAVNDNEINTLSKQLSTSLRERSGIIKALFNINPQIRTKEITDILLTGTKLNEKQLETLITNARKDLDELRVSQHKPQSVVSEKQIQKKRGLTAEEAQVINLKRQIKFKGFEPLNTAIINMKAKRTQYPPQTETRENLLALQNAIAQSYNNFKKTSDATNNQEQLSALMTEIQNKKQYFLEEYKKLVGTIEGNKLYLEDSNQDKKIHTSRWEASSSSIDKTRNDDPQSDASVASNVFRPTRQVNDPKTIAQLAALAPSTVSSSTSSKDKQPQAPKRRSISPPAAERKVSSFQPDTTTETRGLQQALLEDAKAYDEQSRIRATTQAVGFQNPSAASEPSNKEKRQLEDDERLARGLQASMNINSDDESSVEYSDDDASVTSFAGDDDRKPAAR